MEDYRQQLQWQLQQQHQYQLQQQEEGKGEGGRGEKVGRRAAAIDVLTRAFNQPVSLPSAATDTATTATATAIAARSFLDQTGCVYVLNNNSNTTTTNNTNNNNAATASLTIFGCWNFLHQAMNELERYDEEQQQLQQQQKQQQQQQQRTLLSETRLMAEFAVKVARRSNELDQQLVTTCVENYCETNNKNENENNPNNSHILRVILPQLLQSNAEIRDIVTGRIAAYAFHYNHSKTNQNQNQTTRNPTSIPIPIPTSNTTYIQTERTAAGQMVTPPTTTTTTTPPTTTTTIITHPPPTKPTTTSNDNTSSVLSSSNFEDPQVIATFCQFLALNAITNGPTNLQRFLTDWIIPGATITTTTTTASSTASAIATATATTTSTGTASAADNNNDNDNDNNDGGSRKGNGNTDSEYEYDCRNNNRKGHEKKYKTNNITTTKRQRLSTLSSTVPSTISSTTTTTKTKTLPTPNRQQQQRRSTVLHHRLPPYSLACVLYHIASAASSSLVSSTSTSSLSATPYGTRDVLQRLSLPIMANVLLGPVLQDSLLLQQRQRQQKSQRSQSQQSSQQQDETDTNIDSDNGSNDTDVNDRIIAMGIHAMLAWCQTTELSLAQVKHIGSKVRINLTELLGEALHTESPRVLTAVADLLDYVVAQHVVTTTSTSTTTPPPPRLISEARMTQTRYLMQVPDEVSFRSNVSQEQLHSIETQELGDLLLELSTTVEQQRFRFPSFPTHTHNPAAESTTTTNTTTTSTNYNRSSSSKNVEHDQQQQQQQQSSEGTGAGTGAGVEPHFNQRAHALGHSLARIAAAVCLGYAKVTTSPITPQQPQQHQHDTDTNTNTTTNTKHHDIRYRIPGSGLFELISKCASHPSVAICGTVLPVVTPLLRTEVGIATQWLPTLQRRAIIPHHPPPPPSPLTHNNTNNRMNTTNNALLQLMRDRATKNTTTTTNGYNNNNNVNVNDDGDDAVVVLSASEICCVEFEEFVEHFRETVLKEALRACYGIHADYYLASCTAAIEEFCVGESATEQTSFHLEAALFCVVAVAEDVVPSLLSTPTTTTSSTHTTVTGDPTTNNNIVKDATAANYLVRCTVALAKEPKSLNNPLTMVQTCRFIRKFAKWFGSDQQHPGLLEIAADLTLFVFSQCSTSFPETVLSRKIHRESAVVPYSQAAKTLRYLLIHNPHYFLSNRAIAALGAGWEATFAASNRSGRKLLTLQDRTDTCTGICHVLASLPHDQQQTSLMALALASIACLEAMVKRAVAVTYCTTTTSSLSAILERAADEIVILATTARAFTDASTTRTTIGVGSSSDSHSSCVSSDGRASIVMPAMTVLRRAWPTISMAASKFSFNDSILDSLGILFVECMPSKCNTDASICFLQDICTLSTTVIESEEAHRNDRFFSPVLTFLEQSMEVYGTTIDKVSLARAHDGSNNDTHPDPGNDKEMYQCLDSLMRITMTTMINQHMLGSVWTSLQKQGNGQSAFETKTKRGTHNNSDVESNVCSTTGLAPLFSLLSKCVTRCPILLLHILAGGPDEGTTEYSINNDKTSSPDLSMLREVIESAVSSILYPQLEISIQAIKFLEAIVLLTHHHHQSTNDLPMKSDRRNWSDEYQLRCKTKNVLCTLLRGMCGIFQPAVIPDACRLLFHTLSASASASAASTVPTEEEELQTLLLRGLSPEHFFLGDRAWRVIYDFCLPCNQNTIHEMEHIMTDMWQLHRFDNVEAMARSDVVHLFCLQYSQKKNVNVDLTPNSLG